MKDALCQAIPTSRVPKSSRKSGCGVRKVDPAMERFKSLPQHTAVSPTLPVSHTDVHKMWVEKENVIIPPGFKILFFSKRKCHFKYGNFKKE